MFFVQGSQKVDNNTEKGDKNSFLKFLADW